MRTDREVEKLAGTVTAAEHPATAPNRTEKTQDAAM